MRRISMSPIPFLLFLGYVMVRSFIIRVLIRSYL